jgi:methylornithine synthase
MNAKLYAKEKGMLIEEGILAGVGETIEDIADSILTMGRIGARQVRVMSFVPQKGIPMESVATPDRKLEYKIIAVLRLMYQDALIPASLDVDGISGLKVRMDAGANVITSIIPPREGLMGVAQNTKDVHDGGRSVDEVTSILAEMGLKPATAAAYRDYINNVSERRR